MQKWLQQVTHLQRQIFLFFLIRVLYHADKFKDNGFFSYIFLLYELLKKCQHEIRRYLYLILKLTINNSSTQ